MRWLLGTYTQSFNRRHGQWGHLFGGRYKAQLIDERTASYLVSACNYVHLNPKRAGLIASAAPLQSYRWSSYPAYLGRNRNRGQSTNLDNEGVLVSNGGMARGIRVEYAGAFYHVMARGNRRERIFRDQSDRRFFCQTLGEACERAGWRVHAWALMSNHYHLMLETPKGNLVAGMQWLQNTYTRRYNSRHQLWGRLFGDRYKAVLSEGGSPHYYCSLMDYIHLNPVRVGKDRKGVSLRISANLLNLNRRRYDQEIFGVIG